MKKFLIRSLSSLCFPWVAHAGPFMTEDTIPIEYGHVEMIPYSFLTKINIGSLIETPAAEMNVGVFPELQGHLIISPVVSIPRQGSAQYGYGDLEVGAKYRFVEETNILPQMAFYPKVTLPSGDADLGTGLGGPTESAPLWFLKSVGSWKISGGGGYTFSQAPHTFSYAFGGILFQKDLTESLTLGGEFYGQGASLSRYGSTLIFTFGGNYNFTKNLALLFSAAHNIAGAKTLMGYIGLDYTWGPS